MSVDKTDEIPEETIQEEPQERTQEELEAINPQAAIFSSLLEGEPEPEVKEEEVKPVEETEEVEEKPEETPKEEVAEEPVEEVKEEEWSIPEEASVKYPWLKDPDLDYTDQSVVEAANFFAEGVRPEWMPDSNKVSDMDEAHQVAYKSVQRAMTKSANQPIEPQEKSTAQQAVEIYAELQKLRAKDEKITPQPVEEVADNRLEELRKKLEEAVQNSEDTEVAKITEDIVEVKADQKFKQLNIEQKVEELVQSKLTQVRQDQFNNMVAQEDAELAQTYGERYFKYVDDGSLVRVMRGVDPITGEQLVNPSSTTPVHDAYNYILLQEKGGQAVVRQRPVTEAQPPAGSTEGEVPELTQELMDKPWDEFIKDPAVQKEFESI